MLTERKLTERELDHREVVLKNLLKNKSNLVKKYGKDAEKVMYGIATKKAKKKIEQMNLDTIKELVRIQLEASPTSTTTDIDANKSYSGGADYGSEVSANSAENSIEQGETQPLHYSLEEGHGLDQGDIDVLKNLITQLKDGGDLRLDVGGRKSFIRVLNFIIKSNILQDKTKDLSKGKVNEEVDDFEVDNAIGELGDIIRDIDDKAEEAREIVRQVFPNELSRLDSYGAFNMTYSNNRYDVTLGKFVERLEEEGYEIEDGEVYVNEGKLNESPSSEELRMARQAVYRFMKYRQVEDDEAIRDLINALEVLKRTGVKGRLSENEDLNEEEDISKILQAQKIIKKVLKDEGGAAGLKPIVAALKGLKIGKDELIKILKKTVGVVKHQHGDYIIKPITERLVKGFNPGEKYYLPDDGYMAAKLRAEDDWYDPFEGKNAFDETVEDVAEFVIKNQMGIKDPEKIEKFIAGWKKYNDEVINGITKLVQNKFNQPSREEDKKSKNNVVWNWSGDRNELEQVPSKFKAAVKKGLGDKISNFEAAFDAVKNSFADEAGSGEMKFNSDDWIDMIEMDPLDEGTCGYDRDTNGDKLKGPGGLGEKINALVKEKLTKKHDVGDFVDDFQKSDAKQFKGKSDKKKKEMAVAAYLAKQNEK